MTALLLGCRLGLRGLDHRTLPPGTQPSNIASQGLELAGADVILL
jgi:hypothetical protein